MAAPQEEPISDSDFVANDTTVVSHAPVVDWDGLHAISSDIVAWIHIPDTVVNYPVLHGRSNEEYLRADANHNYAIGGSIFIDAENTPPCMIDNQTIVYGHRMSNGSMFNFVSQMSAQDVFSTVETIWYVTEEKTYEMTPLFIYQAAPSGDDVLIYDWTDTEEFRDYLYQHLARSICAREDASAIIPSVEHVITLATCSDPYATARHILVCVDKTDIERAYAPSSGLFYRV